LTIKDLDDMSGGGRDRTISGAHIAALRMTFAELHDRRRQLMNGLRSVIDEIHTSRERLLHATRSRAEADVSSAAAERLQSEYGLTTREVEVARLLAQGLANADVAQRLGISPHTARHHTQRVLVKLGVHSRAAAAARLHESM
jgi:DNA-binding NarL/FixJ family response regulator